MPWRRWLPFLICGRIALLNSRAFLTSPAPSALVYIYSRNGLFFCLAK